ncbi:hypothetical protein GUITHDRAFT_140611 [Guillardia theta CCMP2712]|uniref:Uncharacterized protein n=1 Tax=Guillardia theta (strain CCMP2712) TaxID=905079 RepID=L1J5C4_GUITC|nr:hypothetical protein GUITHDRAFT_140611 [Guillardia theta CCMP2712]EKX43299.1 hypothetical protein GUITHDRAFT_140611 [Guillardia theta CCMP2712]|eukprot:XP_005830279.1 hypothetical protein GUITHDRAFT_140611 [Guillardia theta CCMP2712]
MVTNSCGHGCPLTLQVRLQPAVVQPAVVPISEEKLSDMLRAFYTSVLWDAAKEGDKELCRALVSAGAELEAESVDGEHDPAIHFKEIYGLSFYHDKKQEHKSELSQEDEGPLRKISALALPHLQQNAARTALKWAAYAGHAEVVQLLISVQEVCGQSLELLTVGGQLGAKVNAEDENGWTALHEACMLGHAENQAEIDACTTHFWTPLHLAAAYGHLEVVEILHEAGADICATTEGKLTALDWAKGAGRLSAAALTGYRAAYGYSEVSNFLRSCSGRRQGTCQVCGRSNFFVQGGIATKISSM